MNREELKKYADKLTDDEIVSIKERIVKMAESWSSSGVRLSIKKMAAYLVKVHPKLHVVLRETSCYKDTHYARSRLRSPGTRRYKGYQLKVWKSWEEYCRRGRYGTVIDHDTTETYRQNYEVARAIVRYEENR